MTRRFREAMRLMRSHDRQRQEDGFHQLFPHAADHLGEPVAQFEQEQDDHGLRCWLLELVGAARSPDALPVLGAQLDSSDESLRCWQLPGWKARYPRSADPAAACQSQRHDRLA